MSTLTIESPGNQASETADPQEIQNTGSAFDEIYVQPELPAGVRGEIIIQQQLLTKTVDLAADIGAIGVDATERVSTESETWGAVDSMSNGDLRSQSDGLIATVKSNREAATIMVENEIIPLVEKLESTIASNEADIEALNQTLIVLHEKLSAVATSVKERPIIRQRLQDLRQEIDGRSLKEHEFESSEEARAYQRQLHAKLLKTKGVFKHADRKALRTEIGKIGSLLGSLGKDYEYFDIDEGQYFQELKLAEL